MKYLLIFMAFLFFANLEFAFAGQISPTSHLKPSVEIAPRPTLPLSSSPIKELGQKIIKKILADSDDLMFISGISSLIGLLAIGVSLMFNQNGGGTPIWFVALGIGALLGIFSFILGLKGLKKAKKENNPHKIWGIIGTSIGGVLSSLVVVGGLFFLFVLLLLFALY
jgi:amino acid transporter